MKQIYIYLIALLTFNACLPKDERQDLVPFEGIYVNSSMYDNQIFIKLDDKSIVSINNQADWDLGFQANENYLVLNNANSLAVINLGPVNFTNATLPETPNWMYDASSGNTDSLAINYWIDTTVNPYKYSLNVYVLGAKSGSDYIPQKKLRVLDHNESRFLIEIADFEATNSDTISFLKDTNVNFTTYKVIENIEKVDVYPQIDHWDLLFTSYATILYTSDGIATPYVVNGVLINQKRIAVANSYINSKMVPSGDNEEENLDSYFRNLNISDTAQLTFADTWDIIGYNWKDVTVIDGTSANYVTNKRKIYFIKTIDNEIYKLRFISYYNEGGQKGFPTFEYIKLNE